jgi:hypothetical protein
MRLTPALMLSAALTLLIASAIHAGLLGPIDPFPGAAAPEAFLGAVLVVAALVMFTSRPKTWRFGMGATLLALLGTVYGTSLTVPRGQPGEIAYHLGLLVALVAASGMLLNERRGA